MAIFRQRFVIESPFPVDEAWKKLLAVVKTDQPTCANCGLILAGAGAARFCSSCGQAVSPQAPLPQLWLLRAFSSRQGFEFEGNVSPQGFRISRIISYRNSCIPIIGGRFEPSSAGTRIVIEMKMHTLGYVFLVGGMGLLFVVLSSFIPTGDKAPGSAVVAIAPFAGPCFIYMVCWVFFAMEVSIARAALRKLWESVPRFETR